MSRHMPLVTITMWRYNKLCKSDFTTLYLFHERRRSKFQRNMSLAKCNKFALLTLTAAFTRAFYLVSNIILG